ncbi:VWA domain-containing protein [Neisseriaceae bacterium JH1-16]|nr:VWA domain-containing protein [Neisseriaceae bacterium JH1-16]
MLLDFFCALRAAGLPVSLKEFLTLLEALAARLAFGSLDDFYVLSRAALIKDEKHFDRFDQAFGAFFKGVGELPQDLTTAIPDDWLKKQIEKFLSDEEKAQLEALGYDELMKRLAERLKEQHERHQGGNKWIGTGGTSPFGAYGYNPAGIRIGQQESRHRKAVKVWDQREFRNYDDSVELGTRSIKLALRRLREFARQGSAERLDLDGTIHATAARGGLLDIKMEPELHNAVKVLVLFDVGGSMDDHVRLCEELFSAVKTEFKHLDYFYFHNCVYERVWKDNARRQSNIIPTWDLIHTFDRDYKLIFVGDASMSPYEIVYPGASVEHNNAEAGEVWLKRLTDHFRHVAWLNPEPEARWEYSHSTEIIREKIGNRMFSLTLAGLDAAMRSLRGGTGT